MAALQRKMDAAEEQLAGLERGGGGDRGPAYMRGRGAHPIPAGATSLSDLSTRAEFPEALTEADVQVVTPT